MGKCPPTTASCSLMRRNSQKPHGAKSELKRVGGWGLDQNLDVSLLYEGHRGLRFLVFLMRGCSSIGRASDRHAADAGSIRRCGKGFFSQSQLSVQTLLRCPHPPPSPCAIACINICAHVKDPRVHVKVRGITETLKHPAHTVGRVARLCRIWLSPGKATRISHGRNPVGTIRL